MLSQAATSSLQRLQSMSTSSLRGVVQASRHGEVAPQVKNAQRLVSQGGTSS
jgi:hypothetical protein